MTSLVTYAFCAIIGLVLAVIYVVMGKGDQFHKGLALIFAILMALLVATLAYVIDKARRQ
jgi:uncharacterized membrane protein